MPGATGVALTYDHPNYLGRLINLTPTDTPFTTAMGNLMAGGRLATEGTTEFEWQIIR